MSAETLTPPADAAPAEAAPKRSAVEGIKEASQQLRGTIALELVSEVDHFSEPNKQLLKFHGSYQQENRDARKNRKKDGVGKHYMFMVRCKIPGGKLTADQYLAVDRIAGDFANGTLRFTTRQGIQLHGVLKDRLKDTIAGINDCLLTTLGACGDVNRNVMACPAPLCDGLHGQMQETADILAAHFAPRTRAYHEIWLNGKPMTESKATPADHEPIYGRVYLPRKFKMGLCLPQDNCIDIHAQDLGLLAVVEDGRIVGYNVLVGGGMGMTHGNANTFPHLAQPICYVPAAAVVNAAEAVVKLFRDHGNRGDRKRARIKYLVHDWGVDRFRQVLSEYVGGALELPRPAAVAGVDPHLGWHPQGDGKFFYGICVENGRVKDEGDFRLRSALRQLMLDLQPSLRITPMQDLLLCGLDSTAREEIDRVLSRHGVTRPDQVSSVQKFSMACPAIPTCGLAISESERALPGIIDQLEVELKRLGLEREKLSVRMTGCPNGCARPYQSDIGIVGRSGDKYSLFVGGRIQGDRLNFMLRDLVPLGQIVPTLVPLLEDFRQHRQKGESFGDYCHRQGVEKLQALLPAETRTGKAEHGAAAARPSADGVLRTPVGGDGAARGEAAPKSSNGHGPAAVAGRTAGQALSQPDTQPVPLTLSPPEVVPAAVPDPAAAPPATRLSETFLAGACGEELPDYTFRYGTDGRVRETIVYFYGDDCRAAQAAPGTPLRREAVYQGAVQPYRLHAARKLSDTFYVGPAGHERRDYRLDYQPDGQADRTTVFHYDGDLRAAEAPSGAPLRRQVVYQGRPV